MNFAVVVLDRIRTQQERDERQAMMRIISVLHWFSFLLLVKN